MNQSYSFTIFFFFFIIFFLACAVEDQDFLDCNVHFNCGELVDISYPFWGNGRPEKCGHPLFELKCLENTTYTVLQQREYQVVDVDPFSHTINISRPRERCPPTFGGETFTFPFNYASTVQNLTLFYNCTTNPFLEPPIYNFSCPIGGTKRDAFYAPMLFGGAGVNDTACNIHVEIPVEEEVLGELFEKGVGKLDAALQEPFGVNYLTYKICDSCVGSGGNCGTNVSSSTPAFICFCHDGDQTFRCDNDKDRSRWELKVVIGIGVPFGSVAAIVCTTILIRHIVFCIKQKIRSNNDDHELEAIIKDCGTLPLQRYSFSDVKKITCSLKENLGQGGYGCVYKGKLLNGCLVAVKVLNATKGNGQEFMNEVLSISRTSHVNIVTLLGFCLEGSKRALIYEFMSNGSLEKFIYPKSNTNINHHFLGWENMYRIVIKIAQGLEYLHRGCNTRILHFDIKPHNILLDEDFCPKISDFGLAKLCIKKESIVSILEARGTIGYIAPELFSRNFGEVSHKSDVYSYGMMILEMVGARKNTDIKGENSSETYFPHWIHKRLEEEHDFKLNGGVMTELENEAARKMILVGLWCIQTDPSQRPNISEVLDMLKGGIDNLQIPPRPFPASPARPMLSEFFSSSVL